MGTGSSSTTLIFDLSDIGFNPGTEPNMGYLPVYGPSEGKGAKYASVSFLTLNPSTTNISGTVPLYYSVVLDGSMATSTEEVLSNVSATFSGTSSTITVS